MTSGGHPGFREHHRRFLGIDEDRLAAGETVFANPERARPLYMNSFTPVIATMWDGRLVVSVDPALESPAREMLAAGRHTDLTDDLQADLDDLVFDTRPAYHHPRRMLRLTVDSAGLATPAMLERVRTLGVEERDLAVQITPGTRRGRRVVEERWRWLEPQVREGRFLAVLEDEKLASYAQVMRVAHGAGEIAVATHPEWRRKGYASAVVAAAASWCIDHDLVPLYVVNVRNAASIGLAESLGFRREIEELSVIVFRRDG
jgi:GNAT superfamily N-acetyltransferase